MPSGHQGSYTSLTDVTQPPDLRRALAALSFKFCHDAREADGDCRGCVDPLETEI